MSVQSTATTTWQGSLTEGSGITSPGSKAFADVDVSWASRTNSTAGKTNPEELLAAAHASCYSMALSHGLGEAGNPPERLEVSATVTFVPGEGVKSSELVVKGTVPGIDEAQFKAAAEDAGQNCPISAALKGNLEITVDATLA